MLKISTGLQPRIALLLGFLGGALSLAVASPVSAQQANLPTHDYKHPHADIILPPTLGGYSLIKQQDFYADSLDTGAEYRAEDQSTFISVYIFRNSNGTVPIWFDRAQAALAANDRLGPVANTIAPRSFIPPGQSLATGMRSVYTVSQSSIGIKSTAIVLMPVNDWYVKLRVSSQNLDATALDGLIDRVLNEIRFPAITDPAPAAVPIPACSDALVFAKEIKPARQPKDDVMKSAILGGLLDEASITEIKKEAGETEAGSPVIWCRDASSAPMLGVYRANGARHAYLLGLADSGRAISHGTDSFAAFVNKDPQKAATSDFAVSLIMPDKRIIYAPLKGLVGPDQLYQYIEKAQPISERGTWGASANILNIGVSP